MALKKIFGASSISRMPVGWTDLETYVKTKLKIYFKKKKEEITKILKKEILPRWKRWTLAFVVISLSAKGFGLSVGYALGLAVIGTFSYIILYHMNKWIYERDWIWLWVQVLWWILLSFLLYSYIKNRWYS